MNTRQEHHEEPERSEGLGTRVRRFVDSEVNRLLDKKDRDKDDREVHEGRTGPAGDPDLAGPGGAVAGAPESSRPPETGPAHGSDPAGYSEPVDLHTGGRVGGAQRVGLLNDVASLRDEWHRVQGTFVDNPRRAVHEASVLVDRTLEEIRVNIASGYESDTMSTEDLRVSFQRYREFFQRLLSA
ncbi:MAG: hypothetical protein ACRDUV_11580 [Pseudonocardiaceae bacterium]